MPEQMPYSIVLGFGLLMGFAGAQQRYRRELSGSAASVRKALLISSCAAAMTWLALAIYYYTATSWYWLFIAALFSAVGSAVVFALIEMQIGSAVISLMGFLGWPLAAWWVCALIRDMFT